MIRVYSTIDGEFDPRSRTGPNRPIRLRLSSSDICLNLRRAAAVSSGVWSSRFLDSVSFGAPGFRACSGRGGGRASPDWGGGSFTASTAESMKEATGPSGSDCALRICGRDSVAGFTAGSKATDRSGTDSALSILGGGCRDAFGLAAEVEADRRMQGTGSSGGEDTLELAAGMAAATPKGQRTRLHRQGRPTRNRIITVESILSFVYVFELHA